MKKTLMSIALIVLANIVLANPVLANPLLTKTGSNASECLKMYRHYLNELSTNRSQLMNFLDNCIPETQAVTDEPLHRKLLQIIDGEKKIKTVRT